MRKQARIRAVLLASSRCRHPWRNFFIVFAVFAGATGSILFFHPQEMVFNSSFDCQWNSMFSFNDYKSYREQGPILWSPPEDRYLVGFCAFGGASNQMKCLRVAALVSGILNRTLLINNRPQETYRNMDFNFFVDIPRIQTCFGPSVAMFISDYEAQFKRRVVIDHVACWGGYCVAKGGGKFRVGLRRVKSSITVSKTAVVESVYPALGNFSSLADIQRTLGRSEGRVMFVGDLSGIRVSEYPNICGPKLAICDSLNGLGALPFKRTPQCDSQAFFSPPEVFFQAAKAFVEEEIGGRRFLGFHWRRGDFRSFCSRFNGTCFLKIRRIAACLARNLEQHNVSDIFLATNAERYAMEELKKHLAARTARRVNYIYFGRDGLSPGSLGPRRWNRLLLERFGSFSSSLAIALEKSICAVADVFIGTRLSTFSDDIAQLRYGLNKLSCSDSYVCDGQ